MKNQQLITKLNTLELPAILLPRHKARLKKALIGLRHPYSAKKYFSVARLLPIGILVAITLFVFLKIANKEDGEAQARELVNRAMDKTFQLSTNAQPTPDSVINSAISQLLLEAKSAKDLTILPKKEFADIADLHDEKDEDDLKYIKFTDSQGATVIMGFNKDDLPVITKTNNTSEQDTGGSEYRNQYQNQENEQENEVYDRENENDNNNRQQPPNSASNIPTETPHNKPTPSPDLHINDPDENKNISPSPSPKIERHKDAEEKESDDGEDEQRQEEKD